MWNSLQTRTFTCKKQITIAMVPKKIPHDINVELLLSYFPSNSFRVSLKGVHKRNVYNDIMDIEELSDGTSLINIGRNSIYNALPEYLFHSIDRFCNLPRLEEKERFAEELEKQEHEKENAYRFFAPIDIQLLLSRVMVREELRPITESNTILLEILGDRLTEQQRGNRLIRQAISFLPYCKIIRGNKTLLTFFLRKVLMEEGLAIVLREQKKEFRDEHPQYSDCLGELLDGTYVGNVFDEMVMFFDIYYWPDIVDQNFLQLIEDIEEFRLFIQDYFMSLENVIQFDIRHDDPTLRLSDDEIFNYLNFNTNI